MLQRGGGAADTQHGNIYIWLHDLGDLWFQVVFLMSIYAKKGEHDPIRPETIVTTAWFESKPPPTEQKKIGYCTQNGGKELYIAPFLNRK